MSAVADDLVRIATVEKARGYWATVVGGCRAIR